MLDHQSAGIEIGLAFEPGQPARGDVRALLGRARFFLKLEKNRHTVPVPTDRSRSFSSACSL